MSDTPRTDAAIAKHAAAADLNGLASYYNDLLDHARTLERELAETESERAQAAAAYEDVCAYAVTLADLLRETVRFLEFYPVPYKANELRERIDAALAKNPNPAGHVDTESSSVQPGVPDGVVPTEDSGPVGLGPCKTEKDCDQMPWCRIDGACKRAKVMDRAAAPETPLADDLIEAAEWLEDDAASLRDSCRGGEPERDWACDDCPTRKAGEPKCRGEVICEEQETLATRLRRHAHNLPEPPSQGKSSDTALLDWLESCWPVTNIDVFGESDAELGMTFDDGRREGNLRADNLRDLLFALRARLESGHVQGKTEADRG